MTTEPGWVLVLDGNARAGRSLSRWLASKGYYVKCFVEPREFLSFKPPLGPVCVVLELKLTKTNGFDVLAALKQDNHQHSVIFLTAHGDIRSAVRAIREGAEDFLEKPCDRRVLLTSISRAMALARERCQARRELTDLQAKAARLTPRECEVIRLVTCGLLNKEIADQLGLAYSTVKVHRANAMRRIGAHNAAELARFVALLKLGPQGIRPKH